MWRVACFGGFLVGREAARRMIPGGGTVIFESIFGLPGLGRMLVDAIGYRDFVTVQGVVAVVAIGYVVINSVVDVAYGFIDPRVRTNA